MQLTQFVFIVVLDTKTSGSLSGYSFEPPLLALSRTDRVPVPFLGLDVLLVLLAD